MVSLRRHELGLRIALGATVADVRTLVLRQALRHGLRGVALGAALSLALGQVLQSLLFKVSASDPAVIAVAALVLLPGAVLSAVGPARRASRLDPLSVLRGE
jgi:ABC-type antimicrobial peptide transport system permease subunit